MFNTTLLEVLAYIGFMFMLWFLTKFVVRFVQVYAIVSKWADKDSIWYLTNSQGDIKCRIAGIEREVSELKENTMKLFVVKQDIEVPKMKQPKK